MAGQTSQGQWSIAIGYRAGRTNQASNTIILNASGNECNAANSKAFYVKPVRSDNTTSGTWNPYRALSYNKDTGEIAYDEDKTFIIEHPYERNRYLVHACLEGPEAGVYYRGKGEIINNNSVIIMLPNYVDKLATDFTIQITPIYSGKNINQLYTSEIENNGFTVYGENCKFFWLVQGKRHSIVVEPLKTNVNIKGEGPYKWI